MPSGFPYNNSPLSYPKTDPAPLPANRNPINHLTASEWNAACQAIVDLRSSIISASYHGFVSSSINPHPQAGLSGTNGWQWQSSSLHPQWSTTSSAGLVNRGICLTPTGSYTISGVWRTVWVDPQGVVISGSTEGDGSGGGGSASTSSLDFSTRDLTVTRNSYHSGTSEFRTLTGTFASFQEVTASSGIKTLRLESTGLASLTNLTASAGVLFSLDATVTRNLTTNGNTSVVNLTASQGINVTGSSIINGLLSIQHGDAPAISIAAFNSTAVTLSKNLIATTITASDGIKTSLDLEVVRNATLANITASAGSRFTLDASVGRNFSVTGLTTLTGDLSGSSGLSCSLDINCGRVVYAQKFRANLGSTLAEPGALYTWGSFGHSIMYGGLWQISQTTPVNTLTIDNSNSGQATMYQNGSQPLHLGVGSTRPLSHLVCASDGASVGIGLLNANIGARLHVSGGLGFRIDGTLNHSRTDGKIGLYGNAPVSRPAAYTMNNEITYRNLPSGSVIAQVEGVLRQLVDDLINVGVITGTI
jgi:hypothetical protein